MPTVAGVIIIECYLFISEEAERRGQGREEADRKKEAECREEGQEEEEMEGALLGLLALFSTLGDGLVMLFTMLFTTSLTHPCVGSSSSLCSLIQAFTFGEFWSARKEVTTY